MTVNFQIRAREHARTKPWWPSVEPRLTIVEEHADPSAASARERHLIETRAPLHNVAGVSTPYIAYNRVERGREARDMSKYLVAIADFQDQVREAYAERARLIMKARDDGYGWAEIAEVLEMTVHGAIKASRMG